MWGIVPDANCEGHFRVLLRLQVALITANRTADDADSLESVIRALNTTQSLPVVTLANVERIRRDGNYANQVADRLLDLLFDIDSFRGVGRVFLP